MKMKRCKTKICGGNVAEHSKSGLCHLCSSAQYYWAKKTLDYIERRLERLEIWQHRLQMFSSERKAKKPIGNARPR
jgi:hypothetical protein